MILVIIRMKVFAEKGKELCQTIVSVIGSLRREEGCGRCDCCQSMKDKKGLSQTKFGEEHCHEIRHEGRSGRKVA
jgi:quinol monooxygenase YgiN